MIKSVLTALTLTTATSAALADGLTVTVSDLRNGKGDVILLVFDNARAFDTLDVWKAVDYAQIPARKGQVRHSFPKLTGGPYAVFLWHDENRDEDLNATDTHLLEGVGATGADGPNDDPDFAAASVWPGAVRVRVHYDK